MTALEQQIYRVQEKIQLMLKQQDILLKENLLLKKELSKQSEKEKNQVKHIDELHQQVQILKLNTGDMNEKDKKEFDKQINVYLKEIDKCIALLSQ